MTLNLTTYLHICKGIRKQNADFTYNLRIPVTICGFHLQLRIPQQVKLTKHFVLLFVCGIHRLFWNPQTRLRIPQVRLFLQQFLVVQSFRYLFVESKTAKKIKEKSYVADSAKNLILSC